jgi:hypothetical protein
VEVGRTFATLFADPLVRNALAQADSEGDFLAVLRHFADEKAAATGDNEKEPSEEETSKAGKKRVRLHFFCPKNQAVKMKKLIKK